MIFTPVAEGCHDLFYQLRFDATGIEHPTFCMGGERLNQLSPCSGWLFCFVQCFLYISLYIYSYLYLQVHVQCLAYLICHPSLPPLLVTSRNTLRVVSLWMVRDSPNEPGPIFLPSTKQSCLFKISRNTCKLSINYSINIQESLQVPLEQQHLRRFASFLAMRVEV